MKFYIYCVGNLQEPENNFNHNFTTKCFLFNIVIWEVYLGFSDDLLNYKILDPNGPGDVEEYCIMNWDGYTDTMSYIFLTFESKLKYMIRLTILTVLQNIENLYSFLKDFTIEKK